MLPDTDPILYAAIFRFAHEGFSVPLRAIAAEADVSAALVVKRYGSKNGLREACDEHVLHRIREIKVENVHAAARGGLMGVVPEHEEQALLTGYLMHALLDGGALGRQFVEEMTKDAESYIAEAVSTGVAKPGRDEKARARYMVQSGLGALLVEMLLTDPSRRGDLDALLSRFEADTAAPMLELYSQGFFTSGEVMEEYLLYLSDPPSASPDGATALTDPDPSTTSPPV